MGENNGHGLREDENWQNNYSRRTQQWIHDKFIAAGDLEDFFPESVPYFLEIGYRLSDLDRAFDSAKNARMGIDNLVQIADHHLTVAREKEAAGLDQSAFERYQRAALYYVRASWSVLDADSEVKRDWHGRAVDAYGRMIDLNPHYEIESVAIDLPFTDEAMAAYFHKCGADDAPTILNIPGMDMNKEETPDAGGNRFIQRGMNVLTIDGPGQGETRLRGVTADTPERYQQAGSAAIDWLVERPEVDPDRIGVYGLSMGSYWAPRVVFEDDRPSALATHMGVWYTKDMLFNQAQPFFKKRFMYMAGMTDESELDAYVGDLTLHGIDEEITVPTFIAHGEYDELQTREHARLFSESLAGPTELHLYENQFHPLGGAAPDILCDVADWFLRVWEGTIDDDHDEATFVPDYPNSSSYVPTPGFEFLDQDERPE